MSKSRKVPG